MAPYFGEPLDISGDNKVTLLFLDIKDGFDNNGSYLAGYFLPWNVFSDEEVYEYSIMAGEEKRSNELEMIYIDTNPLDITTIDAYATLAHEYQHLLNFSQDYKEFENTGVIIEEEVWVNEGLSEIAPDVVGYGPQNDRLFYFDYTDIDSLVTWKGDLIDYANVYVFFRYLYDVFGAQIFYNITMGFQTKGIPGVNSAIIDHDTAGEVLPNCGDVRHFQYPYFDCVYRYLYTSIYQNEYGISASLDIESNATTSTTALNMTPLLPKFEFSQNNNAYFWVPPVDVMPGTITLEPYTMKIFGKISGSTPTMTGLNFTQLYNTANTEFMFYNHDASEYAISSTGTINAALSAISPLRDMKNKQKKPKQFNNKPQKGGRGAFQLGDNFKKHLENRWKEKNKNKEKKK